MDTFHFSTVWLAILTSNLLILIVSAIFCHKKILLNAGYKLIAIFLILNVVRLFLPIQFPFVTSVPLPQGISKVIIGFFAPRFFTESYPISIYDISIIIWIIGILVKICLFVRSNGMIHRFILTFGRNVTKDSRYMAIMEQLSATDKGAYRIYEVPGITLPLLYGIRTPFILIPSDREYSDKTLRYILSHELSHSKHHDLWLKFGIQLLCILYWWNPCSYLLKKQLNLVIEMRIDDTITKEGDRKILEYVQSLLHVADNHHPVLSHKLGNVIGLFSETCTDLTKRFDMLMERNSKKNKSVNFILSCVICSIFIASYHFVFEAYYYVPEIEEISFNLIEANSYAVDNGDGTYDIFLFNECIDKVSSLEYYGEDLPVLTKEEFQHVQQDLSEQN